MYLKILVIKSALLGPRQFLKTESPLKMIQDVFHFA